MLKINKNSKIEDYKIEIGKIIFMKKFKPEEMFKANGKYAITGKNDIGYGVNIHFKCNNKGYKVQLLTLGSRLLNNNENKKYITEHVIDKIIETSGLYMDYFINEIREHNKNTMNECIENYKNIR